MAFLMLYERLRIQNRIDVFRTVKDLRDLRPQIIKSLVKISSISSFYAILIFAYIVLFFGLQLISWCS